MKSKLKKIETGNAPRPIGPYSQGVIAGGFLYCSGQIGINPQTGLLVSGGIKAETKQVMKNLKNILAEADLDFSDVVRTDIFIRDINDFPQVNNIYTAFFEEEITPARQTVEVSNLPKNALIEISCICLAGEKHD
ncbi:MAG: RidA family protein [Armatimonadetes bacterium]|nr:MAG: RidA family protein [Armatimonadota bacterium]